MKDESRRLMVKGSRSIEAAQALLERGDTDFAAGPAFLSAADPFFNPA